MRKHRACSVRDVRPVAHQLALMISVALKMDEWMSPIESYPLRIYALQIPQPTKCQCGTLHVQCHNYDDILHSFERRRQNSPCLSFTPGYSRCHFQSQRANRFLGGIPKDPIAFTGVGENSLTRDASLERLLQGCAGS